MIVKSQNYTLKHKLDIKGISYAIFYHEKAHRYSLWTFKSGWQRIGDIYDVPAFLVYIQRLKTTRMLSFGLFAIIVFSLVTVGIAIGLSQTLM